MRILWSPLFALAALAALAALTLGPSLAFAQSAGFLGTFGAPGTGDGQFRSPYDVAVSASGFVYVTDYINDRIQRFSAAGTFEAEWGSFGRNAGQFDFPAGICQASGLGTIFICDAANHRIQYYSDFLKILYGGQFGSLGTGNGRFQSPSGICHNRVNGQIYVADRQNDRIQRFDTAGTYLGQWGGFGTATGQFNDPGGVAAHPTTGEIFATDEDGDRVQRFSSTGAFQVAWGSFGSRDGQFDTPKCLEIDGRGLVYVPDLGNSRIQVFNAVGRFLYQVGTFGGGAGQLNDPSGLGLGGDILYVADSDNDRIVRYQLTDQAPVVTTSGPKTRTVATPTARLSGKARDDLNVDFVEVKVAKASFRKAKGSKNWIFTACGLKPGINRILVRATDLAGTRSKPVNLVIRR